MDRFTAHKTERPELLVCIHCPEYSNCYSNMSCSEIYNAFSKLRYYENLEEQGKLAVLPCKIGDTVYQPSYKFTKCSACNYEKQYAHDSNCEGCEAECGAPLEVWGDYPIEERPATFDSFKYERRELIRHCEKCHLDWENEWWTKTVMLVSRS